MSKSRALMSLSGGFMAGWLAASIASATLSGSYRGEVSAAFWATLAWFMLGGAILATMAAVATYEATDSQ